jgi:hypothetical protein
MLGTLTRPADTTAYASGDLIANSTTAGSVIPIRFQGSCGGEFSQLQIRKSTTTTTGANFRLWLFSLVEGQAEPTVTNGDNGALAFAGNCQGFLGRLTAASMEVIGTETWGRMGVDDGGTNYPRITIPANRVIGFLEARAGYTPGSAEVFTIYGVAVT